MAFTPFTTWTVLYNQMRDDLNNGLWRYKEYSVDGNRTVYTDLKDFMSFFAIVENRALNEQGTFTGRSFAKQGGRGGVST